MTPGLWTATSLAFIWLAIFTASIGTLVAAITKGTTVMSQASDRLNNSLLALNASVDALLAKPAPNDDAELNAAADHVDALKAKVDAAVNPPPAA